MKYFIEVSYDQTVEIWSRGKMRSFKKGNNMGLLVEDCYTSLKEARYELKEVKRIQKEWNAGKDNPHHDLRISVGKIDKQQYSKEYASI